MQLHPGIQRGSNPIWSLIESRDDQGAHLKHKDERRCENTEQRQPVSRADEQVKEYHRPRKKDKELEEVRQRATPNLLSPNIQECRLADETGEDCEEVE